MRSHRSTISLTKQEIPVDPKLAAAVDAGMIELFEGDWLDHLADSIENMK